MKQRYQERNKRQSVSPASSLFGKVAIPTEFLHSSGIDATKSIYIILSEPSIVLKQTTVGYEDCTMVQAQMDNINTVQIPADFLHAIGVNPENKASISFAFPLCTSDAEILIEHTEHSLPQVQIREHFRFLAAKHGILEEDLRKAMIHIIEQEHEFLTRRSATYWQKLPYKEFSTMHSMQDPSLFPVRKNYITLEYFLAQHMNLWLFLQKLETELIYKTPTIKENAEPLVLSAYIDDLGGLIMPACAIYHAKFVSDKPLWLIVDENAIVFRISPTGYDDCEKELLTIDALGRIEIPKEYLSCLNINHFRRTPLFLSYASEEVAIEHLSCTPC